MADHGDSLFREVEEQIRREQMQKIWERYNGLIIIAVALILLGVGGYKFLENRRIVAEETAGDEFTKAENLDNDKKTEDADKIFANIAESGPAGYAALARLHLAGEQVKAGKTADAIATYDMLAKQSGANDLLKNFAQLQAASLRMPDADYAELESRLAPLARDGAPYAKSARELLGVAAYKAKKYEDARKYLEPLLTDPTASPDMQDRVKIVMEAIASAEVGGGTSPTAAATPPAAADGAAKAEPPKTEAKPAAESTSEPDKKP